MLYEVITPFSVPLDFLLEKFQVSDITLTSEDQPPQHIERMSVSKLSFKGDQLKFADLSLVALGNRIQLKGDLQTNSQYLINGALKTQLALEGFAPVAATANISGPLNQLKLVVDVQQPAALP